MTATAAAELRKISKKYGERFANENVDLVVRPGTIHGLMGENGAGKSTAMKILFGLITPDSGEIWYRGSPCTHWNPRRAFQAGMGMVHQHLMLANSETVLDNLVLGVEATTLGLRRRNQERTALQKLMDDTGLHIDLDVPVAALPLSHKSRCEILKVLYRKADFLILDEPTAVLTPPEIEAFLETLKKLRAQGKTILIVTHKLKEIMDVADEVTVLRTGRTVGQMQTAQTTIPALAELMIGRKLALPHNQPRTTKTRPLLSLPQFQLTVEAGEIVGIAGVEGNGQEELMAAVLHPPTKTPVELRREPMAIIPPDRHAEGLVLTMTLEENLALGRTQAAHKGFALRHPRLQKTNDFLKTHDIRPAQSTAKAQDLSGGNQQKLIIARELHYNAPAPHIILAVHPTRGVDLGAIEHIHGDILQAAAQGAAVLLISSELEELMSLSHRIGVLHRKKIVAWFDRSNTEMGFDEKSMGLAMMTGVAP